MAATGRWRDVSALPRPSAGRHARVATPSDIHEVSNRPRVTYPELIRSHGRFLGFGLSLTFLSSFGQTFFISLFNESVRSEFALSHGEIGGAYSLATLASGFTLAWVGKRLDSTDLRRFTAALCIALAAASFGMALATGAASLVVAFFLLRLTGQGLLSHTSLTSMSRYFDVGRGKAMSIAGLGYPMGEAVLPLLAVFAIGALGWRETWLVVGLFMVVVALPGTQLLLKGHGERERRLREELDQHGATADRADGRVSEATTAAPRRTETGAEAGTTALRRTQAGAGSEAGAAPRATTGAAPQQQWTLAQVLRDRRFVLMLPAVVAPGFIITGFFFHQNHLVAAKGWTVEWFATCFAVFALSQLVTGLAAGPMVDRFGGRRLLAAFTLPMGMGLTLLSVGSSPWIAAGFMVGLGVTAGLSPTVVGAMWAEVYGVLHLGAIRAMAQSVMVFGTAASPILMGVLIDRGTGIAAMAWGAVGWVAVAAGLVVVSRVGARGDFGQEFKTR